jgi:putative lipoic acid-binding regulatory protein
VIGVNGDLFKESIEDFKRQFPDLIAKSSSLSRNGTYLSMTFELEARDVDDIISLWVASEEISDFVKIL